MSPKESQRNSRSVEERIYIGIDGNPVKTPVAFCHYKKHYGYMSEKMLKLHGCLQKNCGRLRKLDCPYWEERRQKKLNAKLARKQLEERKL